MDLLKTQVWLLVVEFLGLGVTVGGAAYGFATIAGMFRTVASGSSK